MSLDLFDPLPALQNAQTNLAREIPADFSEAFDVSTRAMTEWNSSVNYSNARDHALATLYDDVKAKTGVQLPLYGMGGNVTLDELNDAITKLPQDPNQPEQSYRPLSENDIDTMALTRMRRAHDDQAAFARRETTWGGTLGTITGTLAAGVSDPVAIATLPLGGAGQAGIALRALEFALIGGGTEAVIAGAGGPSRERAVPGSLMKEVPGELASAALFGGVFGAGLGGLQKLMGTGARALPVTVRDEVNAATSEAQLNLTNPFPTAAGEAAARDATIDATRSAVRGEPVRSGDSFPPEHVADYALAAKSQTPEDLALAGEKHLRPETFDQVPDVERFERMPGETDDAASYWESRLASASPEERAALGATDEPLVVLDPGEKIDGAAIKIGDKIYRGENHTHALDRAAKDMKISPEEFLAQLEGRDNVGLDGFVTTDGRFLTRKEAYAVQDAIEARAVSAPDLAPAQISALEADPKTFDAAVHDLDHILTANPEAEFTTQTRLPDGTYAFNTQKLSDVVKELDEFERAGKELEACIIGLEAAE
jgi:hypothetical protein